MVLFITLNHGLLCEGGNTGNVKFNLEISGEVQGKGFGTETFTQRTGFSTPGTSIEGPSEMFQANVDQLNMVAVTTIHGCVKFDLFDAGRVGHVKFLTRAIGGERFGKSSVQLSGCNVG